MLSHAKYGNCFTFNELWNGNDQDPLAGYRTTALTGPDFGLYLTMNLQQINYMGNGISKQVDKSLYQINEVNLLVT